MWWQCMKVCLRIQLPKRAVYAAYSAKRSQRPALRLLAPACPPRLPQPASHPTLSSPAPSSPPIYYSVLRILYHRWSRTSTTSASSCLTTTKCSTHRWAGERAGNIGTAEHPGRGGAAHALVAQMVVTGDFTTSPRVPLFAPFPPLCTQRDKVYAERRRALEASDLTPLMIEYAERTIDDILEVGLGVPHSPSHHIAPCRQLHAAPASIHSCVWAWQH